MLVNILNLLLLTAFLVYCALRPRNGIIITLFLLLSLPIPFSFFGFSFADGGKYLPNIFLILLFYVTYYLVTTNNRKIFDTVGCLILLYISLALIACIYVSESEINIGLTVKRICITPLFFFLGEVFANSEKFESDYKALWKMMLFLGIYMMLFSFFEFFSHQNVFAILLSNFINLVGTTAFADPLLVVEAHLRVPFYRILGPQIESTETALVTLLAFIFYLAWPAPGNSWEKKLKIIMLVSLPALILINSTRTAIIALFLVVALNYLIQKIKEKQTLLATSSGMLMLSAIVVVAVFLNSTLVFNFLGQFEVSPHYLARIQDDTHILGRLSVWNEALETVNQNFWLGIGFGESLDMPLMADTFSSHNYFLDLLIHHGLLLTIFINIIFFIMLFKGLTLLNNGQNRTIQQVSQIFLLLTLVMLIFGTASPEKTQLTALFWFFGGMVSFFGQRRDRNYAG